MAEKLQGGTRDGQTPTPTTLPQGGPQEPPQRRHREPLRAEGVAEGGAPRRPGQGAARRGEDSAPPQRRRHRGVVRTLGAPWPRAPWRSASGATDEPFRGTRARDTKGEGAEERGAR